MTVTRVYNSLNKRRGDFGFGWDLALSSGIKIQATHEPLGSDWGWELDHCNEIIGLCYYNIFPNRPSRVLVTYADGRQDRFEMKGELGIPIIPPEENSPVLVRFEALEPTTSSLVTLDGDLVVYNGQDHIDTFDPEHAGMVYAPDLFALTTADGIVYTASITEGLKSIRDRNGNVLTFGEDGIEHSAGNQLTVTRTRTLDGLLRDMVTTNVWDGMGRLVKSTDPLGHFTSTEYNAIGKMAATVDKRGLRTEYFYSETGELERTRYADGTEETAVYDANGNRLTSTDRAGRVTEFEYDAQSRLTKTTWSTWARAPDTSRSAWPRRCRRAR